MPKFNLTIRRVWHETFELEVEAATREEAQHTGKTLVNNDPNFREDRLDPVETIIECVEPAREKRNGHSRSRK